MDVHNLRLPSFLFSVSVVLIEINVGRTLANEDFVIENKPHPCVLVPGYSGSQLELKTIKEPSSLYKDCKIDEQLIKVWGSLAVLLQIFGTFDSPMGKLWTDCLTLVYNHSTRKTSSIRGIQLGVSKFGDSSAVEWQLDDAYMNQLWENIPEKCWGTSINATSTKQAIKIFVDNSAYFASISKHLNESCNNHISIKSAPYDFRLAPNEQQCYFKNLECLVEETYYENEKKPVVFIAHSMGCVMTYRFLLGKSQQWKDKFVHSFISLAGPYGGAMEIMGVYSGASKYIGSTFNSPEIVAQHSSLAWMCPFSEFWGDDKVLASTSEHNYTITDMKKFFYDNHRPDAWEMYKDVTAYRSAASPPGVEVHCLCGNEVETLEEIRYKGSFGESPDHVYSLLGDGVVNQRSLEGCLLWRGKQKEKVHHQVFENVGHMSMMNDDQVLNYIIGVVGGENNCNLNK